MKTLAMIAVLSLTGVGSALAQEAGDNATYKSKTVYDFEDDNVEGDLQRPDGELVNSINKAQHESLIEIRKNFIPKFLKRLKNTKPRLLACWGKSPDWILQRWRRPQAAAVVRKTRRTPWPTHPSPFNFRFTKGISWFERRS